jgi:hypothetical protein
MAMFEGVQKVFSYKAIACCSKLLFIYYHNSCGWQELINGNFRPIVVL